MDQLRSLMQSALAQRLAEHLRAEVAPVANIPSLRTASVQDRLTGGLRLGTLAPRDLLDTLGLAREGIDYGAKALTGGIAQEVGGLQAIDNPVLRNVGNAASFLLPGGPVTALTALATEAGRIGLPSPFGPTDIANAQRAAGADQGNIHRESAGGERGPGPGQPLATGLLNQLVNPLTYATGGGTEEARAAQQAGRIAGGLGLDLNTVNSILYPEGHLIGKASSAILGPAVRGVLDRTGSTRSCGIATICPPRPRRTATWRRYLAEDRAGGLFPETGPHLPPELARPSRTSGATCRSTR
jgi:hypothetical protein